MITLSSRVTDCFGMPTSKILEGFNWYNEKKAEIKQRQRPLFEQESSKKMMPTLPQYEQNIRSLQLAHQQAHRMALDNPTTENLLMELRLEKIIMSKSRNYAERRVAVAIMESEFINMKNHSNVLHRKVQEQVDSKEVMEKLHNLSKEWGIIMQVQDGCPHSHAFAPIVLEFAGTHGFELLAATVDGGDFEHIEGVKDNGEMVMFNPSRETPILYLVKNDGREVLPISRGINNEDQIIQNIMMIDQHIRRLF
jgi:conjugal transfer pilus assembly protein TraF